MFALSSNNRRELKIEALWPHKEWLVLKFTGVHSISDAEALVGCELQVPRQERANLEIGWSYISDLIGCMVYDSAREIGPVVDVRFGAGEAPLLVVKAGAQEYEIPYAEAYLKTADLSGKRVDMALPEGLLELNAGLSEEEKREQAGSKKRRVK
jgi:16S rRNA processing protein RimM